MEFNNLSPCSLRSMAPKTTLRCFRQLLLLLRRLVPLFSISWHFSELFSMSRFYHLSQEARGEMKLLLKDAFCAKEIIFLGGGLFFVLFWFWLFVCLDFERGSYRGRRMALNLDLPALVSRVVESKGWGPQEAINRGQVRNWHFSGHQVLTTFLLPFPQLHTGLLYI